MCGMSGLSRGLLQIYSVIGNPSALQGPLTLSWTHRRFISRPLHADNVDDVTAGFVLCLTVANQLVILAPHLGENGSEAYRLALPNYLLEFAILQH